MKINEIISEGWFTKKALAPDQVRVAFQTGANFKQVAEKYRQLTILLTNSNVRPKGFELSVEFYENMMKLFHDPGPSLDDANVRIARLYNKLLQDLKSSGAI